MAFLLILTPMLYQGCSGDGIPDELYLIEKAEVETTGLPSDNNHDPSNVIYYEGRYYVWYTQHMVTPGQPYDHFAHNRIDYITSPDGIRSTSCWGVCAPSTDPFLIFSDDRVGREPGARCRRTPAHSDLPAYPLEQRAGIAAIA